MNLGSTIFTFLPPDVLDPFRTTSLHGVSLSLVLVCVGEGVAVLVCLLLVGWAGGGDLRLLFFLVSFFFVVLFVCFVARG